jgi:hypothetical protein
VISLIVFALCFSSTSVYSFRTTTGTTTKRTGPTNNFSGLAAAWSMDKEIDRTLAQARVVLEKSKAKLAEKENETDESPSLPFFASPTTTPTGVISREGIIKSRNAETGLVRADGERMAALSEQEEWEARPLLEVFESEIGENGNVYSPTSQSLGKRDLAMGIWNLRRQLQNADFQKIFDKRNRFIQDE